LFIVVYDIRNPDDRPVVKELMKYPFVPEENSMWDVDPSNLTLSLSTESVYREKGNTEENLQNLHFSDEKTSSNLSLYRPSTLPNSSTCPNFGVFDSKPSSPRSPSSPKESQTRRRSKAFSEERMTDKKKPEAQKPEESNDGREEETEKTNQPSRLGLDHLQPGSESTPFVRPGSRKKKRRTISSNASLSGGS